MIVDIGGWYFEVASRIFFRERQAYQERAQVRHSALDDTLTGKLRSIEAQFSRKPAIETARQGRKASKFILAEVLQSHKFVPRKALSNAGTRKDCVKF